MKVRFNDLPMLFRLDTTFRVGFLSKSNTEKELSFSGRHLLISSFFIFILVISLFTLILFSVGANFGKNMNDASISREKLESQYQKIRELQKKINEQDLYFKNIQLILGGNLADSISYQEGPENQEIEYSELNTNMSKNEKELFGNLEKEIQAPKNTVDQPSKTKFIKPVNGYISRGYNPDSHAGLDLVTQKNGKVRCSGNGKVLYAGFSQKDGYVLIIGHPYGYVTVYKHNQKILKKIGQKVVAGDIIALVGNTGENSSGPHLHFEIWKDLDPIDPSELLSF
jgi:murein DD-endopeptidase MepM/ murein hydrolase activator NlpD